MSPQQDQILTQLEQTIQQSLDRFESSMTGVNDSLLEGVKGLLARLKKRRNGTILSSVENLKLVNEFRKELDQLLIGSGYTEAARTFIASYSSSAVLINSYFSTVVESFQKNDALYKAVLRANVDTTLTSLLGSGVDANFKDPIIKILRENIAGGTSSEDLRKLLTSTIVGDAESVARLTRYSKQITSDALEQFSRNYMETLSADLGLNHYLYGGTIIADSRPFCAEKAGKYFTEEEVKSWASKDWSGKIKGTNASNIKTYLGGHSCKHRLLPVSKEMYDRQKAK